MHIYIYIRGEMRTVHPEKSHGPKVLPKVYLKGCQQENYR